MQRGAFIIPCAISKTVLCLIIMNQPIAIHGENSVPSGYAAEQSNSERITRHAWPSSIIHLPPTTKTLTCRGWSDDF